jgi:hypothetical protein
VLTVMAVALLAAACGSSSAAPPTTATATTVTTVPPPTTAAPTTTTTPTDSGLLPQTTDEPSIGPPLQSQLTVLWNAMVADSPTAAASVFFPQSAYLQLKTGLLPNPTSDYTGRLVGFYNLDIGAYHQLVTSGGTPTLLNVVFAAADAAWIPPGQCDNRYGYWHLPGVRLVYQSPTGVSSVAVASLISWRGVWYVVHLGPNPRPSPVGTVDQPESGHGVPGPAGGC